MKKTGIVILTIALIAVICGSFYVVNDKSKRANQKEKVLTEVQRIPTNSLSRQMRKATRTRALHLLRPECVTAMM